MEPPKLARDPSIDDIIDQCCHDRHATIAELVTDTEALLVNGRQRIEPSRDVTGSYKAFCEDLERQGLLDLRSVNPTTPTNLDLPHYILSSTSAKLAPRWSRYLARIFNNHPRASSVSPPLSNALRSASQRLSNFRLRLRQGAHGRVYRYLISRQLRRHPVAAPGIFATLRHRKSGSRTTNQKEDGAETTQSGTKADSMAYNDVAGLRSEGREPGARRRKLAGYLKAANDLRQSYFAADGTDRHDETLGQDSSFPDAAIVRTGHEEMILFPSYAHRHVKSKTSAAAQPNESQQEFWQREWDRHQADNAVVDVNVRGWLYTPHRGPATRKQRLVLGIARQMSGLPAPSALEASPGSSTYSSQVPSRSSSPTRSKQEEELIAREAERIARRGEAEGRRAQRGEFSEKPGAPTTGDSQVDPRSRDVSPDRARQDSQASAFPTQSLQNRSSWNSATMTQAEYKTANEHLTNRIKPFMANALGNTPVSAFFYNEKLSRQHTVYTDASGHFTLTAMLDFIPTHVRVFAGDKLSATEEVIITSSQGVSLISDVDDTVKHSAISHGAKEIFRNAFLRDLHELTIEGVREWYNTMHDMGVNLHYVSNSPWQMYPLLSSFFKLAHLPRGSFHLKQYTGLFQGVFEPVAERKKSSLDKIMRDFPDRKFVLVGDSGEADLEVYTDVALENPGKVLGIFIRDVTTPIKTGYFDSSAPPLNGKGRRSRNHSRHASGDVLAMSKKFSRPDDIKNDDADLQAAIAASLADVEAETRQARRSINPDAILPDKENGSRPPPPLPHRARRNGPQMTVSQQAEPEEDLIDLTDPPAMSPTSPSDLLKISSHNLSNELNPTAPSRHQKSTPSPRPKPQSLRSRSSNQSLAGSTVPATKTPPPRPRKPSSAVKPQSTALLPSLRSVAAQQPHQPSPLSQDSRDATPKERPPLPARKTYRELAKEKLVNAYNATSPILRAAISAPSSPRSFSTVSSKDMDDFSLDGAAGKQAPQLPRRRQISGVPFSGARAATSNRMSGAWDDESLPSSPGEAGMSRKEWLWRQRWAKAREILEPRGVTLRSWRVGSDAADVCVRLVEMALKEMDKDNKKESERDQTK